jgi:hypothetical protein
VDVDAEVEGVVVPIGVMFAAPVAFALEPVDIVIDLPAVRAVAGGIEVDAFFGMLEAAMALVAPMVVVVIGAGGAAQGKREAEGESGGENESQVMFGHDIPPKAMRIRARRTGQSDGAVISAGIFAVRRIQDSDLLHRKPIDMKGSHL